MKSEWKQALYFLAQTSVTVANVIFFFFFFAADWQKSV